MLALKLLLVPSFLALVSLAGRRWGPGVAGWLAGFPVVAGAILLVLALERGPAFAGAAATASLSAVFASVLFSLAYSHACLRFDWPVASPIAIGAWALASLVLNGLPSSLPLSLTIAIATLLAAPQLFPATDAPPRPSRFGNRELLLRMMAGAALTLAVSALATAIGPARSGLLAVFPVIGAVLTVFSQRLSGPAFVIVLLRAMVRGLYSFVAFCLLLSVLLPESGIATGFVAATAGAGLVQLLSRAFLHRDCGAR